MKRAAGDTTGTIKNQIGLGGYAFHTGVWGLRYFSGSGASPGRVTGLLRWWPTVDVPCTISFTVNVAGPTPALTQINLSAQFSDGRIDISSTARAPLTRHGDLLTARISFADGNPSTSWPDFTDWIISIRDPNDADNDGVPDLIDQQPLPLQTIALDLRRLPDNTLSLSVRADNPILSGQKFTLLSSSDLQRWLPVTTTIANENDVEFKLTPVLHTQFFRVASP